MTGATYPSHHVPVAYPGGPFWMHAVELAACLALGQRALVVGPPGSGKTTLLMQIGRAINVTEPDAETHVLLIDRPVEEFLEWRADLPAAHVHGTSTDDDVEDHTGVDAPFAHAQERLEQGLDTVLLIDSLAAFARALNATLPYDERILTGGIMMTALQATRQRFATARALEGGGSITIVATASMDTGSELDDVVFHELVGTGNMEIRLSAEARDARLFPALDIAASGARHTELIVGEYAARARGELRSQVSAHGITAGLSLLLGQLESTGDLNSLLDQAGSNPESTS